MDTNKRFLVVGAGTMGGGHARLLASGRVPGAELAGVVDLNGALAESVAKATASQAFTSLEEAIAAVRPDCAYVATPDALHREPVERLAAAGVAILVEKPLATTVDDGEAMVAAVKRAGVYAEVNFSNRWNPPFAEGLRAIEAGDLGEVRSFNVRLNNPISSPRDRLAWSGGTTPAWFLMSHCLDLAHWFSGKRAVAAYASGSKGVLAAQGIDTWDWIHATVIYENGGDGVFEAAWILPESWPGQIEFNFRVLGTHGAIDVDTTRQSIAVSSARHHYPPTLNWAQQRFTAFVRAVDGQGRTRVSFEDGLEVTRILVAIHSSLASGQVERVRGSVPA
ncbi:MAG: Gfo/Idh/MocA family oxidoreductase [Dehalococcoidia bacterium]